MVFLLFSFGVRHCFLTSRTRTRPGIRALRFPPGDVSLCLGQEKELLLRARELGIYTPPPVAGGRMGAGGGRFSMVFLIWDGPSGHRAAVRSPQGPSQPRETIGKSISGSSTPGPTGGGELYPGPVFPVGAER